jgi:hypothetical protein
LTRSHAVIAHVRADVDAELAVELLAAELLRFANPDM